LARPLRTQAARRGSRFSSTIRNRGDAQDKHRTAPMRRNRH